jgi:hypothetical protein
MVASKEMALPVSPDLRVGSCLIPAYSLETHQKASRLERANFSDKDDYLFRIEESRFKSISR